MIRLLEQKQYMLKRISTPFKFGLRSTIADALLVGNSFVWYYMVLALLLQEMVSKINPAGPYLVLIWGLHFGGLIISAVVGADLSKRLKQTNFIVFWMAFGAVSSLGVLLINPSDIVQVSLVGLFLGVSLGLGMPTCIGRYANSLPIESRGRVSGITLFVSGIGIVGFSILGIGNIVLLGIILATWRLLGLIIFLITKRLSQTATLQRSTESYKKIISKHSFIFYLIPWVMFSLINYLVAPSTPNLTGPESENLALVGLVQIGFIGIFALLGGFLMDSLGRKRVAVTGFILLGIGTATLGISTTSLPILYLNAILDGTAWGFLLVLFILTLWGDLSIGESSEKYYALGVMPFFISKFLDLTVGSSLSAILGNSSALFSFGSFFLFLAVLPLIYAPETLPEKVMKDRDLKSYIEKAQKAATKESEKKQKRKPKVEEEPVTSKDESKEDSQEYEEARKLAEKYY
jgi:hypothetical protein